MDQPIKLMWTDEGNFVPVSRYWSRICDERFVIGQTYALDEIKARSHASHAHYFAVLHEIWLSLPESIERRFINEDQMRKHALIHTGYRTEVQHVCKSHAEAERLASAIRPYDDYQIVLVSECVVTVYHAKSQDMRSMDKAEFQASKDAVLEWCGNLVGATAEELSRAEESA